MTPQIVRGVLLLSILAGCGAEVWAALVPLVRLEPPTMRSATVEHAPGMEATVSDSLVQRAIERPVFRAGRRAARVPFDPSRPAGLEIAAAAAAPKPMLQISGILWGSRPAAVVEGIPGMEGSTVLERGESVAGIRVARIDSDHVVLRGLDTTWTLPVRDPWK
jgi:hypothetical protein